MFEFLSSPLTGAMLGTFAYRLTYDLLRSLSDFVYFGRLELYAEGATEFYVPVWMRPIIAEASRVELSSVPKSVRIGKGHIVSTADKSLWGKARDRRRMTLNEGRQLVRSLRVLGGVYVTKEMRAHIYDDVDSVIKEKKKKKKTGWTVLQPFDIISLHAMKLHMEMVLHGNPEHGTVDRQVSGHRTSLLTQIHFQRDKFFPVYHPNVEEYVPYPVPELCVPTYADYRNDGSPRMRPFSRGTSNVVFTYVPGADAWDCPAFDIKASDVVRPQDGFVRPEIGLSHDEVVVVVSPTDPPDIDERHPFAIPGLSVAWVTLAPAVGASIRNLDTDEYTWPEMERDEDDTSPPLVFGHGDTIVSVVPFRATGLSAFLAEAKEADGRDMSMMSEKARRWFLSLPPVSAEYVSTALGLKNVPVADRQLSAIKRKIDMSDD